MPVLSRLRTTCIAHLSLKLADADTHLLPGFDNSLPFRTGTAKNDASVGDCSGSKSLKACGWCNTWVTQCLVPYLSSLLPRISPQVYGNQIKGAIRNTRIYMN